MLYARLRDSTRSGIIVGTCVKHNKLVLFIQRQNFKTTNEVHNFGGEIK